MKQVYGFGIHYVLYGDYSLADNCSTGNKKAKVKIVNADSLLVGTLEANRPDYR